MRDVDDVRLAKLLREFPSFPVEFVMQLYKMDRLIDELEYLGKEFVWKKEEIQKKRDEILEKALRELEKMSRLPKEK